MQIELTDQERLLAQQGHPIDVVDAKTNEPYVLVAKQRIGEVQPLVAPAPISDDAMPEIPEGIRLSQEAFRRKIEPRGARGPRGNQ